MTVDFKISRLLPLLGMVAMAVPAAWVVHDAFTYTHVSNLFPVGAAVFASGWTFVFMFMFIITDAQTQRRSA